jgi:hypothetical protein
MVTDKDGYMHLIQYLTEHLGLFETPEAEDIMSDTVLELFEEQLAAQIIMVCVREVDAIVYDLEEILAKVANQRATASQSIFVSEFSGLIKNLFDQEIDNQLR